MISMFLTINNRTSSAIEDFQVDALSKVKFVPNVIGTLKELKNEGYELVMVSNQDGLGTESFPEAQFESCQQFMLDTLSSEDVTFKEIFRLLLFL